MIKKHSPAPIKRILSYIKPYSIYVALSIFCSAVGALSGLAIPILCGKAIDCMVSEGAVLFDGIVNYIISILCVVLVSALSAQILSVCNNRITFCVSKDLRNEGFRKLHRLPLSYLDSHPSGDILSRMISDIDALSDGLLMSFTQLFTGIITIIGTLVIMLIYNAFITMIVVVLTPLSLLVAAFIAKSTHKYFSRQAKERGAQTALINELIDAEKVIKAFNHEDKSIKDFDETNERLSDTSLKATFFSSLTNPSTRLVNNIVYAVVGLISAFFSLSGAITIGQLSVFLSYASQYAKPFNEISSVVTELQNAFTCADRIFAFLDEKEEDRSDSRENVECVGKVEFKNVSFSYSSDRPLLQNISVNVSPGQKIAIVGPTGCGKTTLINLLMRFYDTGSGQILIDGVDIKDMSRDELRSKFGMVLQDTFLKSGTIKENIAYSKPDALDDEIIEAAKKAHAHSFIRRLPDGYNTYIGENGGDLSAGQKQLLCIARVMLSLPPMLILDEATSSIDIRTEIRIQKAFSEMMRGRTTFIVAHRLSTIKNADLILVMNGGTIVEQGTHKELLQKGGFYASLYNSQFALEEDI